MQSVGLNWRTMVVLWRRRWRSSQIHLDLARYDEYLIRSDGSSLVGFSEIFARSKIGSIGGSKYRVLG